MVDTIRSWWGERSLALGEGGYLRLGARELWLQRSAHDWLVATRDGRDPLAQEIALELPGVFAPPAEARLCRYAFSTTHPRLSLTPRLADRPLICRPEAPLTLLPRQQVELLVSSPIWVALAVGEPLQPLLDLPLLRLSDSWFGPPTRPGGLSYATTTRVLTERSAVHPSPLRAITPVAVRNSSPTPVTLERLNLPLPMLELYHDRQGGLWSGVVKLEWERAQEVELTLVEGPPTAAAGGERVATARQAVSRNLLFQAVDYLFGEGAGL